MSIKRHYACDNTYLILHQYLSRFDLKAFTDFDDITYSGILFQALCVVLGISCWVHPQSKLND